MKKTWAQKMADKPGYPKILTLEEGFPCYNAVHSMGVDPGETVVIVNPSEVIPIMASVPKGKLISIREICPIIAKKHKVKGCCSLVTGIYLMTIANAVEEAIIKGDRSEVSKIPYWRTLKADGFLNEKYPGGAEAQKKHLEAEGFKVISRGKKFQVENFGQFLYTPAA